MDKLFDNIQSNNISYHFPRCYATADECPQREHCLSHKAAIMNGQNGKTHDILPCVVPTYIAQVAAGKSCKYFHSDEPLKFAKGMKKIFDNVPQSKYYEVRSMVKQCFTRERAFFYAQNGKRLITPNEQDNINNIFKKMGLAEPEFDEYIIKQDW